jgi:toxin-antitoxin system PIN domain toxin
MELVDANVLIGAFRPDDPDHEPLKGWLEETVRAGHTVTFPVLVEAAFLRIVTHPRIFRTPSSLDEAASFLAVIHESGVFREAPWSLRIRQRWWTSCQDLGLGGDDVNDAYLAAIALETPCRLASRDRGFARFRGLDWRDPARAS